MSKRKRIGFALLAILIIGGLTFYLFPTPKASFQEIYAKVDAPTARSLQTFRQNYPLRQIQVDGTPWTYIAAGKGEETILFLHGMTGAHDIWWQQIDALQDRYRIIAVTYPPVETLEGMSRALRAILAREQVGQVNVVGTSLGGYFAQYLVAQHPTLVQRAVFANTFPPNDLIAEKNRTIGTLLPWLPEWLVMAVLQGSFKDSIYPAAGQSEIVLAFLMEQAHGAMSKAHVVARYRCVIEPFTAPDPTALGIPVLIIEADNDPLVEKILREQLKATYPSARLHTLSKVGHFPYLNEPQTYTRLIEDFLRK